MPRFIHSLFLPEQAIAADGLLSYDLPVNPLTCLLINLKPLNESSTITTFRLVQGILSALDSIVISHKGTELFSMSGADAYMFAQLRHGLAGIQSNPVNTDNDRRSLVLPILFGRNAYDPTEGIPKTKRGELNLDITWDIADTGFDGLRVSMEAIELPEADPSVMERVTTLTQTFAATGDNDVALPVGNKIRGIMMFGTTGWAGAAPAPTLGRLSVLKDNLQTHFSASDFETLRAQTFLRGKHWHSPNEHLHGFADAAAGQVDTQRQDDIFPMQELYAYMDFDPTDDDTYTLETEGAAAMTLRVNAEAANAARFLPVEIFPKDRLDL